jgi:hypothetical protein
MIFEFVIEKKVYIIAFDELPLVKKIDDNI